LYLERLLYGGGDAEEAEPNDEIRRKWQTYCEENGNHALHERLREVDAESADAIHENNVHRVIRALEIFETTGVPKSEWDKRSKEKASDYEFCVVGLRYGSRELLYDRINRRVDAMMESGLLEETKLLMEVGVFARNSTAAQAIGYKELLAHLDGEESLLDAVERLKTATRRYAKRQITWFSAKPYVQWVDADDNGCMRGEEDILSDILAHLEKH
jgi:tRNA dimethylallyltransferase